MIDTFGRLPIMVWQVELLVDFLSVFGYSLNNFLPSNSTLIYEMSLAEFKRIVSWRTILVPSTLDSSMATLQSALNTLGVVCLLDPTDVNQVQMNLEVRLSKI